MKKYNDTLNYQSKPELLIKEECIKRGIKVINGPKIESVKTFSNINYFLYK